MTHVLMVTAFFLATLSFADSTDEKIEANKPIEEVVSIGKQPGPKLWRVSHDDHELWILGVLNPLPKDLDWDSSAVEAVLSDSDAFISAPGIGMSINPLKTIFVLPSLLGVQKNPDGKKLVDIVPADIYARWTELKALYIGKDKGIERKRPIIAVNELYQKAIESTGLTHSGAVYKTIDKAVKRNDVQKISTSITRHLEKPREAIKKFKKSEIEDIECFEKTLNRIEADLAVMQTRAQAWASGDFAALRELPYEDQNAACFAAVLDSAIAEEMADELGLVDLESMLRDKWLAAAEQALQENNVTFATLPVEELLNPEGYVAELAKRGYAVRGG